MPAEDDIEQRLKAVLSDPDNQGCSECDRQEYKPIWASFLTSPVDKRVLGVVCCKKCYKLFNKVEGADFTLKSLEDLKDWTKDDIDALELSGNQLVNAAYEATVTNEKEGRDKRKYGYEAFFFEKYVNLTHFDEVLYKQLINQASKSLVEKRFNKSLRGYNLKKTAAEAEDEEYHSDESDGPEDDSRSSHGEEPAAAPERRRGAGMQRANSARGIRARQGIANRRRQSARNLMNNVDDKEEGNARPSMSRHRLNSIRRELNDPDSNHGGPDSNGRMRRKLSSRNVMSGENDGERQRGVRRASSRRGLSSGGGEESGVRRMNSKEEGRREDRRGVRRASSRNRLDAGSGHDDEEGTRERRATRDARNGRHRLLA